VSGVRVILITVAGPGGHVDVGVRSDATPADLADALGGVIGVSLASTVIEHRSPPRPGVPEGARVLVRSGTALSEAGVADGDLVLFRTSGAASGYSWPEVQGRPAESGASSPRPDASVLSSARPDAPAAVSSPQPGALTEAAPEPVAPAQSAPGFEPSDFGSAGFGRPAASAPAAFPAGRHARSGPDQAEPQPEAAPGQAEWPARATEPGREVWPRPAVEPDQEAWPAPATEPGREVWPRPAVEPDQEAWPAPGTEPGQEDQPRKPDSQEVSPGDWPG
jgi:hypothetical protein